MPNPNDIVSAQNDQSLPAALEASRRPIVSNRDGEIFANSRDVAAFFEKEHRNVLRDIRTLQDASGGMLKFEQAPFTDAQNGQTYQTYDMSRDAFMVLAMGFTGTKALKWKLDYVAAFNAMEAEVRRQQAPMIPQSLPEALRLAADLADDLNVERGKNAVMAPKVDAFERIASTEGTFNLTEAAKALQMKRKDFIQWCNVNSWIYRKTGSTTWLGYRTKEQAGLLTHKMTPGIAPDGTERVFEQVRFTAKGMAKLALIFGAEGEQAAA